MHLLFAGGFSREQLAAGGGSAAMRERHAAHFEALAERAHRDRWHHEGLDEVERDRDNLRAALELAVELGDRAELGPDAAKEAWDEGLGMRLKFAIALAKSAEPGIAQRV